MAIKNTPKLNTNKTNSSIKLEDDTSFNRLKDLQKLLKKESAVKELFVRMKDETKASIERQCVDVLKKKMEVLDILQKINKENKINNLNNNNNPKEKNKSPVILKEYILEENNYDYLSDINTFVTNILKYLWEEPKILANLLMKADVNDVKEYLAPLICNNFYQNILSSNYIEDPLIYIIYLMLKNEIDSIKNIEQADSFLNNNQCSFILGQLIEQNDVKEFFKIILQNCLEDLGTNRFRFNLDELNNYQIKRKKTVDKSVFDKNFLSQQNVDKSGKRKSIEQINNNIPEDFTKAKTLTKVDIRGLSDDLKENIKNNINYQVFTAQYLISIPLSELKESLNKNQDDVWLKSYYEYLLLNSKEEKDAYSLENFTTKMARYNNPESVLFLYQEYFVQVTEFVNNLFSNLTKNYRIIPYAIKMVCKIIYQLATDKFPKATETQKSLLISKFFFKTLLFPILERPDINALINNYIISERTIYNLKIISNILWKLSTFQLYKINEELKNIEGNNIFRGDFAPFNKFFLEKIPEIFKIYKSLIDVNLPKFINGLMNKSINENEYCFDFFNENQNEISYYQTILLNIKQFNALFTNLDKNNKLLLPEGESKNASNDSSKYSELKKRTESNKKKILLAIKKIKDEDNLKLLSKLVTQIEYSVKTIEIKKEGFFSKKKIIEERKEKVKYFHISQLLFNEKSNKIFSLEQKKFYYHIKEIKEKERKTQEMIMKNNIIKCKNFISSILYNYRILNKDDFEKGKTNNTMDILKELEYFMKSSNFLIDGTIPSEWYLSSLMQYLKTLPDEYKRNDYQKLFSELTDELNESIKTCNFEYMSLFLDEMKFGNRNKAYFEKVKAIYMDIELNNKANIIIENDIINITLFYKGGKKPEFMIYQEGLKEKQIEFLDSVTFDNRYRGDVCKTIDQFTKIFPDLNKSVPKNEIEEKIGLFQYQTSLDIPNKLGTFFNIITGHLKNKIKNENELKIINDKIYDYVMSRIYDKIYPKGRNIQDLNLLQKTCKLNWLEPENVIKGECQYDFDFVLPDINDYFKKIRLEKSPRKKIINLDNIFLVINRLLKFNKGDGQFGVDDQLPLLSYCFIKARPWKIFTDSHFMKLYIGSKKNKAQDNQLSQLLTICDMVRQAEHTSFNNVTKEDYHEKSDIAYNEATDYMSELLDIQI